MYLPATFAKGDLHTLHEFIDLHDFGVLVSPGGEVPEAAHLPFLLDRASGPQGTLIAHVARANPLWKSLQDGQPALAIFSGPHAYISPGWYEADHVVPTWNYLAVHASGPVKVVSDDDELWEMVRRLVERHESPRARPWRLENDAENARRLLSQIVGLKLTIERLDGKWKLGQNRPVEQRRRVIAALRRDGGPGSEAIAALMEEAISG